MFGIMEKNSKMEDDLLYSMVNIVRRFLCWLNRVKVSFDYSLYGLCIFIFDLDK